MNLISFDLAKLGSLSAAIIVIFILGYVLVAIVKKINFSKSPTVTKDNLDNHHEFTKDKFNNMLTKLKDIEDGLYHTHERESEQSDHVLKEIMSLTSLIKELLIYFKNVYNQK